MKFAQNSCLKFSLHCKCITLSKYISTGHLRCPPGVDLSLYLGNVSVTDNGRTCQKWRDQYPHAHFFRNPHHFHHDGGIAETENYCRNMGEPVPFCITTDTTFPFDSCVERICTGLLIIYISGGCRGMSGVRLKSHSLSPFLNIL